MHAKRLQRDRELAIEPEHARYADTFFAVLDRARDVALREVVRAREQEVQPQPIEIVVFLEPRARLEHVLRGFSGVDLRECQCAVVPDIRLESLVAQGLRERLRLDEMDLPRLRPRL